MANAVHPLPKCLPAEWLAAHHVNISNAKREEAAAERLRAECERLRKETENTTARVQQTNLHKFSQRIRDIAFWREELEKKLSENSKETGLLAVSKKKLEEALANTEFPLEVANQCLQFRSEREQVDLVHDAVEIQLIKEVEVLQGVQGLLQRTLDQAVEQMRLLRSVKYHLEKDLTEKLGALGLDETCSSLKDNSEEIGYGQRGVKIQTNSITPSQWSSFTNENILKTEKECNASSTLRGIIDGVLEQTRQDINRQRVAVNLEFSKRIFEVDRAKKGLEHRLQEILKQVELMDDNIAQLIASIENKSGPMMLAQTRLEIRSYRPSKELVRDPVQYGLVGEVQEISDSIQSLEGKVMEAKASLKALLRNQVSLEEDIAVKTKSLFIEQEQCMALRNQLPS